jgi:cell wall-associated NlpC family hydrolase
MSRLDRRTDQGGRPVAQHAKVPMYKRVHPIWAVAAVIVSAVTVGTYSLWTSDSPAPEEEAPSSAPVDDNWHPPIVFPKVVEHPVAKRAAPPPKPKKPVKAKVKTKVVQLTRASRVVAYALAQVGKSYLWGGNGPNVFDCSGLTKADFAHVGVHLPRTSQEQSLVGTRVSLKKLKPGDLLFWGPAGASHHVAIYIGHGEYVAAENPISGVVIRHLSSFPPDFARRVL